MILGPFLRREIPTRGSSADWDGEVNADRAHPYKDLELSDDGIPEFDSMSDSSFISLSSSSSSLVCLSFLFHISVLLFLSSKCTILRFVLSERCVKKNQLTMLMTLRRIAIYQKVLLILDSMRVWNW